MLKNTERNLRETRAIACCYEEKSKILLQIRNKIQRSELELALSRMKRRTWNQATKK